MIFFRFAREFSEDLLFYIEKRFPDCGTTDMFNRFASYLDPAFKGVHLGEFGVLDDTKKEIMARWKDEVLAPQQNELENLAELDPTENLLRVRRAFGGQGRILSKIEKEMATYESLPEIKGTDDRLLWWKNHSEMLPILARAAREVITISFQCN